MYHSSDENTFLKLIKVSKAEAQTFNIFDKLIGALNFAFGNVFLAHFDVWFVSKGRSKDGLEVMINLAYILLYELKTHLPSSPESETATADRGYNN